MITTSVRRIAAVLAACVLAVTPVTAGAAAAAPSTPAAMPGDAGRGKATFGVQPSGAKQPDGRPDFSYGATPGAVVHDHIAVWNYGTRPLTLNVYAADAFTTADGGFDLLAAGRRSTGAGSWVTLEKHQVTVDRQSSAIIPFTLTVPRNATPGDHAGGIVASLSGAGTDAKGDRVTVDQRVGARIYLRLAGELKPRLTVENPHATYHGTANPFGSGSATVTYTVRNTGNVRLGAHQAVRVSGLFGDATAPGLRNITELLPGASLTITASVAGVRAAMRDTATVTVDPVVVRGDVVGTALPHATAATDFWAVPWTLLALLLLLLVAAAGTVLSRRRRRPGPGAASGGRSAAPAPPRSRGPRPVAAADTAKSSAQNRQSIGLRCPAPGREGAAAPSYRAVRERFGSAARRNAGHREPGAHSPRIPGRVLSAAPAVALAAGLTLAAAPGAQAADAAQLTVSPQNGSDTQPITLTAGLPCPQGTSNVIARVAGAGFPRGGQIVVGNAPLITYPNAPGVGPVVPLIFTMRDYATTAGFRELHGTYTFTLTCLKGAFDRTSLQDFTGSLRFTSTAQYADGTKAAAPAQAPAAPARRQPSPGNSPGPGDGSGAAAPSPDTATRSGDPAAQGAPARGTDAAAPATHRSTSPIAYALGGLVPAALLAGAAWWAWRRRTLTFEDLPHP